MDVIYGLNLCIIFFEMFDLLLLQNLETIKT